MSRAIKLALLICDLTPIFKSTHGDYGKLYTQLLSQSLARISSDIDFTLDSYDVVEQMKYPLDDLQYDGLLISGSRATSYEDVEWINKLVAYIKRIITEKLSLKIFGICFGHQIVARALDGTCTRNEKGWEVAVTPIQLTFIGKAIFGADVIDIQQMHSDHVPTCPPGAQLLGFSDNTPNHGMVVFEPSQGNTGPADTGADAARVVDLTSIQVLTIQGHPEFTESIMSVILDARRTIFGEKLTSDGRLRAGGVPGKHYPDGLACDGVGKVGKVIWGVLGVA